jgi:hypothetical protein
MNQKTRICVRIERKIKFDGTEWPLLVENAEILRL